MKVTLGEKIRLTRLSKGLSQENLAEELALSVGAYSNIERGKTNISIARLEEIANVLKTDLSYFLDMTSGGSKGTKESSTTYVSIRRMEERLKEMEIALENKDKEISYLKEIIVLMKGNKTRSKRKQN